MSIVWLVLSTVVRSNFRFRVYPVTGDLLVWSNFWVGFLVVTWLSTLFCCSSVLFCFGYGYKGFWLRLGHSVGRLSKEGRGKRVARYFSSLAREWIKDLCYDDYYESD